MVIHFPCEYGHILTAVIPHDKLWQNSTWLIYMNGWAPTVCEAISHTVFFNVLSESPGVQPKNGCRGDSESNVLKHDRHCSPLHPYYAFLSLRRYSYQHGHPLYGRGLLGLYDAVVCTSDRGEDEGIEMCIRDRIMGNVMSLNFCHPIAPSS